MFPGWRRISHFRNISDISGFLVLCSNTGSSRSSRGGFAHTYTHSTHFYRTACIYSLLWQVFVYLNALDICWWDASSVFTCSFCYSVWSERESICCVNAPALSSLSRVRIQSNRQNQFKFLLLRYLLQMLPPNLFNTDHLSQKNYFLFLCNIIHGSNYSGVCYESLLVFLVRVGCFLDAFIFNVIHLRFLRIAYYFQVAK